MSEKDINVSEELLKIVKENRDENKKQARRMNLSMIFTGGIFVIFLVAALILVPPAFRMLKSVNNTLGQLEGTIADASGTLNSITATSNSVNSLVEDSTDSITGTFDSISKIDFAGLNTAIEDLQESAASLRKVTSIFN